VKPLIALGQKQTSEDGWAMSALPPKADIAERDRHVRFVPKAESCTAAIDPSLRQVFPDFAMS